MYEPYTSVGHNMHESYTGVSHNMHESGPASAHPKPYAIQAYILFSIATSVCESRSAYL